MPSTEGRERPALPLVWNFVALNPHLAIMLDCDDEHLVAWDEPTEPTWRK